MVNPELMTGLGAALAIFFASAGSAVASVPAGVYAMRTNHGIRSFGPIVIAGVLAIYGIIIAVLLGGRLVSTEAITEKEGARYLASGLSVGLACLASGSGMGGFLNRSLYEIPGQDDATVSEHTALLGTRRLISNPMPPTLGFLFVLVFLEAIGLYGLIAALVFIQ